MQQRIRIGIAVIVLVVAGVAVWLWRTSGRESTETLAELGGIDPGVAQRTILARKTGLSTSLAGTKSPVTPISV